MVTITDGAQKRLLFQLFMDRRTGGQREFSFDILPTVCAVNKKIKDCSKRETLDGLETGRISFDSEKEISFGIDESKFIKDLLAEIKQATPEDFEIIQNLKALFELNQDAKPN